VTEGAGARLAFAWQDTREQLEAFALRWPAAPADERGRVFTGDAGARLWLPLLLPAAREGEAIGDYERRIGQRLDRVGSSALVLLQAGAAALGYWQDDELLAHKAIKKYVVRGSGKAQPTHRKTRGKSRYGSRLRLQNWTRLLVAVNERLHDWWSAHGVPAQIFHAAPVRSWPELFAVAPPPPFDQRDARLRRVPLHVHVPDFAELQRVRRWLARGRLELPPS
jgi:hypothetical protein